MAIGDVTNSVSDTPSEVQTSFLKEVDPIQYEMAADYAFLPVRYPRLLEYYRLLDRTRWSVSEVGIGLTDRTDWEKLTPDEQSFLKFPLAFFAQADGLINENLLENFSRETSFLKEARAFYSLQHASETIHNECYSVLIDTVISSSAEKSEMLTSMTSERYPSIRAIGQWIEKAMNPEVPLLERVLAFAGIEGILFASSFAAIYWVKRKNLLPGLTKANEWIARDETIHTQFASELYTVLVENGYTPVSQEKAFEIIGSCVEVGKTFIEEGLRVDLVGLTAADMTGYISCVADTVLGLFGFFPLFRIPNPLRWMEVIGMLNKSNFFETTVTEYAVVADGDWTLDLTEASLR